MGESTEINEAQVENLVVRNRSVIGRGLASLADLGYRTCGIDEGWEACGKGVNGTQHDVNGNPVVDTSKFPDMGELVKFGHSKGIRMGWWVAFTA